MSVRDELVLLTPRLRRYARALTQGSPAPHEMADELVHATFMRILDCGLSERKPELLLQVFSLLTQINREEHARASGSAAASEAEAISHGSAKGLYAALGGLRLDEREALFLVVLEGFTYAQAARILHISRGALTTRLGRARTRLGEALSNDAGSQTPARRVPHLRVVK
ncbi:MAG: sigma factor-like helix-turn-helix DNA-binding protein [Methylovirgula sp.]